ncbi:hypothetical protein B4U80_15061 [Leptotrombidium deliense]|uniref:Ubiquitin-like protease family profile domain-containing protein n=1 Tax=Leptotrombidium deliense TaxID=299467 RepID=A0A443RES4_9ACAR|nr:hypothetical protein B4U80_15061 [Leptotrombidium deliense]
MNCNNLSNFEIEKRLKNIKNFEGVFSIDELYHIPKGCGVINFDKSDEKGSHWVSYYNDKNFNFIEYFDSFGELNEIPNEIITFLKKSNKIIKYNDSVLQQLDSSKCGCFCIFYIKQRNKGKKPLEILNSLNQFPSDFNEMEISKFS